MQAISTPCINVCVLERATGICAGCGRTTDEIATWSRMSEGHRLAIMAALDTRLDVAPEACRREVLPLGPSQQS